MNNLNLCMQVCVCTCPGCNSSLCLTCQSHLGSWWAGGGCGCCSAAAVPMFHCYGNHAPGPRLAVAATPGQEPTHRQTSLIIQFIHLFLDFMPSLWLVWDSGETFKWVGRVVVGTKGAKSPIWLPHAPQCDVKMNECEIKVRCTIKILRNFWDSFDEKGEWKSGVWVHKLVQMNHHYGSVSSFSFFMSAHCLLLFRGGVTQRTWLTSREEMLSWVSQ